VDVLALMGIILIKPFEEAHSVQLVKLGSIQAVAFVLNATSHIIGKSKDLTIASLGISSSKNLLL